MLLEEGPGYLLRLSAAGSRDSKVLMCVCVRPTCIFSESKEYGMRRCRHQEYTCIGLQGYENRAYTSDKPSPTDRSCNVVAWCSRG